MPVSVAKCLGFENPAGLCLSVTPSLGVTMPWCNLADSPVNWGQEPTQSSLTSGQRCRSAPRRNRNSSAAAQAEVGPEVCRAPAALAQPASGSRSLLPRRWSHSKGAHGRTPGRRADLPRRTRHQCPAAHGLASAWLEPWSRLLSLRYLHRS